MLAVMLLMIAGFGMDFLITIHYRSVTLGRAYLAAVLSVGITLIGALGISEVANADGWSAKIGLALAYALSTGIGTLLGMKVSIRKKKPK